MNVPRTKAKRLLLSAYACEPDKGSEPAVGWNWAVQLSRRGYEVWVITRSNNQAAIEAALPGLPEAAKLHFVYYDLPERFQRWKKRWLGINAYYALWQRGAAKKAAALHAEVGFDLVHHVTFVGLRQASHMWRLGIPFILGPVAGGERAPFALRRHFSLKAWLADLIRDCANFLVRVNPSVLGSLAAAEQILVTSEQTKVLIPHRYQGKTHVQLAIGLSEEEVASFSGLRRYEVANDVLRILYVGRFIDLKGMGLGIPAFARLAQACPSAELTLVGTGPASTKWEQLAKTFGVGHQVRWIDWVSRDEMANMYSNYDVLFFPSLRDSGGMVVLEAMACGLPVVCLDIGGPGVMVDASCGIVVATSRRSEDEIVAALAAALEAMADPVSRRRLSAGARKRVQNFLWASLVATVYEPLSMSH